MIVTKLITYVGSDEAVLKQLANSLHDGRHQFTPDNSVHIITLRSDKVTGEALGKMPFGGKEDGD